MPIILPYFTLVFLYILLAWYFWQTEWHDSTPKLTKLKKSANFLLIIAILLHFALLAQSIFINGEIHIGFANATSAILWLTTVIYGIGSLFFNLKGIRPFVLPITALTAILPLLFSSTTIVHHTELLIFKLHLLIAALAYGLFAVAAFHSLLMAFIERGLHQGAVSASWQPPLLTMEKLLFQIILIAFVLLTLTLLTGVIFSETLFNRPLLLTHKIIFAFLSWGIFLILLIGRKIYGWRGRIAIRCTLIGFFVLLLAYVGTKFVLEVILHR